MADSPGGRLQESPGRYGSECRPDTLKCHINLLESLLKEKNQIKGVPYHKRVKSNQDIEKRYQRDHDSELCE